jgi:hypothetical protein
MSVFRQQVYKIFLAQNRPFYHITPTSQVESILATGLQKKNILGICCALTTDEIVIRHIIDTQLKTSDENDFTIIKIEPFKFELKIGELARDQTLELTNILHLNIVRDSLQVTSDDIIGTIKAER